MQANHQSQNRRLVPDCKVSIRTNYDPASGGLGDVFLYGGGNSGTQGLPIGLAAMGGKSRRSGVILSSQGCEERR